MLGFSKSYTSYTIDNLDFVIALGIDVSDTDESKLKVSFEFTKSSNYSPDSSSSESETVINTVEASSIDNAINLMNAHMGKELKLSHCKLVVFSEKLAEKGISNEIYTLVNNVQIRPSTNIIISKCESEKYLSDLKPSIESYITKYFDVFPDSGKYTGYTTNATIGDFFYSMSTNTCEPFAILGGPYEENSSEYQDVNNIISGNIPINSERKVNNFGLAVFKNDKLVGELSALDTLCFSILADRINNCTISVPNPKNSNDYLDLFLYDDKSAKINVDIINNSPYVSIDVKISGIILTTTYNSDYLNDETLQLVSNYASSYLESSISNYLYKTAKDYKADITCIGKRALKNFRTWKDYESFNWKDRYRDSFFNVKANVNIKSGSLITES